MNEPNTEQYEAPAVLESYSTAELIEEAAGCQQTYPPRESDEALKDDIARVPRAVSRLTGIGTTR